VIVVAAVLDKDEADRSTSGMSAIGWSTSKTVVSAGRATGCGLYVRLGKGGGIGSLRDFAVRICGTGIIDRGGLTGATGRGGKSVRAGIGGGGFAVRGCPSASRNFRICSSSELGCWRIGGAGRGGGPSSVSVVLLVVVALLASHLSNAAIPTKSRKSQLSIAASMVGDVEALFSISHLSLFTSHRSPPR
jgi:hypothetical protein